ALTEAALNELHGEGVTMLWSAYHAANEASCEWHRKFGFAEEPIWSWRDCVAVSFSMSCGAPEKSGLTAQRRKKSENASSSNTITGTKRPESSKPSPMQKATMRCVPCCVTTNVR